MPSESKIAKLLGTQTTPQPPKRVGREKRYEEDLAPQLPVLSVFRPDEDHVTADSALTSSRDESDTPLWQLTDRFPIPQSFAHGEAASPNFDKATLSPSMSSTTFKSSHEMRDGGVGSSQTDTRSVRVRRKRDIGRLDGRERSNSNAQSSTQSNIDFTPSSLDQARYAVPYPTRDFRHRQHPAFFDTETSSMTYGSEHSSRSANSHHTPETSSVDPYAFLAASQGRLFSSEAPRASSLRRHASVHVPAVDLPLFPSSRSILMLGMLTQDFDVKIDTGHRRTFHRRKEWLTRCIMLCSNARQAQGQLSSKLANLTGADTIGESNFFFDTCSAEKAFASLHLFKTHVDDTREDDRLHITSNSYVAVAETTNNEQSRAQWGLRIAGLPGASSTTKSRAAEATQVEWTLRFDSKFRMLDWQTTLRALIIALTEAESEFRTGLKAKRSVASLGGASSCNSPLSPQWSPTFHKQHFGNLTQQMYNGLSDSDTSDDEADTNISPHRKADVPTPPTIHSASISEANILDTIAKPDQASFESQMAAARSSKPRPEDLKVSEFGRKQLLPRAKVSPTMSKLSTSSSRVRYSIQRGADSVCPPPLPPPRDALPPAPSEMTTEGSARDVVGLDELDDQVHDLGTVAYAAEDRQSNSARSSMTSATDRSSMSKRCSSLKSKIDGKAVPDVPESVAADFRWSSVLTKHGGGGVEDMTVTSFLDSASSADSVYDEEGMRYDASDKRAKRSGSLARQAFESLTLDSKTEHIRVDSPIDPVEQRSGTKSSCDDSKETREQRHANENVKKTALDSQHLQAAINTLQASCTSEEEADALLQAARELARRYRARRNVGLA